MSKQAKAHEDARLPIGCHFTGGYGMLHTVQRY